MHSTPDTNTPARILSIREGRDTYTHNIEGPYLAEAVDEALEHWGGDRIPYLPEGATALVTWDIERPGYASRPRILIEHLSPKDAASIGRIFTQLAEELTRNLDETVWGEQA